MQIFIDSANIREIEKWLRFGIADGVTTNPSIMLKDGMTDMEKGTKEIAAILGWETGQRRGHWQTILRRC